MRHVRGETCTAMLGRKFKLLDAWSLAGFIYLSTYLSIDRSIYLSIYLLPLGLSRINRPEVVSHLRARIVSYRF